MRRLTWMLVLAVGAWAQAPAKPPATKPPVPKTADGKTDFSGVWQGGSLSFAVGEANAAALGAAGGGRGAGAAPVKSEPMPYTEAAQKTRQGYLDRRGIDDPMARCLMVGVPRITTMPMPFQITQTKDQVLFLYEAFHAFRIAPFNKQHPEDGEPSFMGDSVARWDGDTLVLDVVGFNDKTWLGGVGTIHSEKLHVTERFTRVDYDTIVYEVKMEDPVVFTKPYNQRATVRLRANDRVREYECGENNEDILRFEEILKTQSRK